MAFSLKPNAPIELVTRLRSELQKYSKNQLRFSSMCWAQRWINQIPQEHQQLQMQADSLYIKIIPFIDSCDLDTIQRPYGGCLYMDSWRTVFKEISHINFINVKQIVLSDCDIINLEPLSWMNCPNVKQLQLSNNGVYSLKIFKKTNFKKLEQLLLWSKTNHDNLTCLNRMKINQEKFDKLLFQYCLCEQIQGSKPSIDYFYDLLKFESNKINQCILLASFVNNNAKKKLKQKFPRAQKPITNEQDIAFTTSDARYRYS